MTQPYRSEPTIASRGSQAGRLSFVILVVAGPVPVFYVALVERSGAIAWLYVLLAGLTLAVTGETPSTKRWPLLAASWWPIALVVGIAIGIGVVVRLLYGLVRSVAFWIRNGDPS